MSSTSSEMRQSKSNLQHDITIVVTEIEAFGGAERSLVALSRWLYERSIPHQFLVYYDHIGLAKYASHPIQVTALNPDRNALKKILSLRRHFQALPTDAPKPLMSGLQAALHGTLAGIGMFHTLMHDTPSLINDGRRLTLKGRLRQKVTDRILAWGLGSGGQTIVTSGYLNNESELLWNAPVKIARMGGMAANADFRPRTVEGQMRMLSVSRIEWNKRIDWILRSLAKLEHGVPRLSQRVDWRLDVVGRGPQINTLRSLSQELNIGERVEFPGFVTDEQLREFYERSHLFLMPARQGYGIPAVEALSRGIPVLLHRESGISDLLLETPWCVVMEGGEGNLPPALDRSITSLLRREHVGAPLPTLPTENEWAERVSRICGWFP